MLRQNCPGNTEIKLTKVENDYKQCRKKTSSTLLTSLVCGKTDVPWNWMKSSQPYQAWASYELHDHCQLPFIKQEG